MVNLFPEAIPEGGKEAGFLQRCPGLSLQKSIGFGPIRGLWAFSSDASVAFVVSGTSLYKIDAAFTATLIGAAPRVGSIQKTAHDMNTMRISGRITLSR